MNLSAKFFIAFLAASFALIYFRSDSLAAALIPPTLVAGFCVDICLKALSRRQDDRVDAQLRTLKERIDIIQMQKGLSR